MDTFTLTGTLLDPEGVAHVGVQIHAVMTPTVKVDRDDDKVYSRPVTAVTDSLGQFSAALLTMPDLWYQLSCILPVFTPNPLRFEAPADGVTLDIADIVDETPTPTYNAVTVLIGDGGAGAVTSVAGRTGVVVLTKSDVGLSNVDDTTDAGKPISTATATALAAKATPADITAAVATEATARAAADTTLQTNIDGKADTSHTHAASQISDSTTVGRAVLTAADAAAARAATGAGTSNLALGTSSSTAKAGDYQPAWTDVTSKPSTFAPTAHTHPAVDLSDSTTVGRALITAVDAAAARTATGAGTSNLALGTSSSTAKAGDYQPTAANISDSTSVGRSVLTAADAAAARTAIGAGTSSLTVGTTTGTVAAGDDSRITGAVQSTRQVTAGTGLTGGGDLSADRTLTVAYGTSSTTATVGNDARVVNAVQGINGGGETYYDAGNSSTAITLSLANGNLQKVTMTGNCTLTLTGPTTGALRSLTLWIFQDGTGSRTMTWPASVKWGTTGAPTLTTTASKMDMVNLQTVDGGTNWYAAVGPKGF